MIYIYCHPQTVLLNHNSLVGLDMQNASSWDRNPSNFMLDLVSYCTTIKVTYVSLGIIMHFLLTFICYTFCANIYISILAWGPRVVQWLAT